MQLSPGIRKLGLAFHITVTIGWLGAVAAFLVLALSGLHATDGLQAQATYPAMGLITRYLIIPLSFMSLLTGLIQSLGTPWGLFRHYWVTGKLLLTLLAIGVLLIHAQPIGMIADAAAERPLSPTDFREVRVRLVIDAAAGMVVLLLNILLSVYKPGGMVQPRGLQAVLRAGPNGRPRLPLLLALALAGLLLCALLLHHGGPGRHPLHP